MDDNSSDNKTGGTKDETKNPCMTFIDGKFFPYIHLVLGRTVGDSGLRIPTLRLGGKNIERDMRKGCGCDYAKAKPYGWIVRYAQINWFDLEGDRRYPLLGKPTDSPPSLLLNFDATQGGQRLSVWSGIGSHTAKIISSSEGRVLLRFFEGEQADLFCANGDIIRLRFEDGIPKRTKLKGSQVISLRLDQITRELKKPNVSSDRRNAILRGAVSLLQILEDEKQVDQVVKFFAKRRSLAPKIQYLLGEALLNRGDDRGHTVHDGKHRQLRPKSGKPPSKSAKKKKSKQRLLDRELRRKMKGTRHGRKATK